LIEASSYTVESVELNSMVGLTRGIKESVVILLNLRTKIKAIMRSYSEGFLHLTAIQWKCIDRIDSLLYARDTPSKNDIAYIEKHYGRIGEPRTAKGA
jgi:hypothetical protein